MNVQPFVASPSSARAHPVTPRAFTLIELLVVVGVIALLIAIVTVVGGRVIAGSKATLTQDSIKAMDQVYAAYMADTDFRPDPSVPDPRNAQFLLPVADARNMTEPGETIINSIGLFIHQMERSGQPVQATIAGLSPRLVSLYATDPAATPVQQLASPSLTDLRTLPQLRTILDPWGRPLRYVHPAFSGPLYDATFDQNERNGVYGDPPDVNAPFAVRIALPDANPAFLPIDQIRRNSGGGTGQADSDGGLCPSNGGRGYFYSAGPDGDPSTIDDNIYVDASRPTFPK